MALYFISDLHLQEQRPALTQGFLSYVASLQSSEVEALYILGDFFEYWVGDDDSRALVSTVKSALNELRDSGVQVYFQHGNRDFLLGQAYADACGMQLLEEEHIIEHSGHTFLLMHGDSLCTSDSEYMAFRAQSRDPQWQQHILNLSLAERYSLAEQMRETSQQATRLKAEDITDVTQATVIERMRVHQVQHLIHGHTHRPEKHTFELNDAPATRTVLGDWSDTHGWQIILDAKGLELSLFNFSRL